MTTHKSVLWKIAHDLIRARHPQPVRVEDIYRDVESQITFDAEDLVPPSLHGGRVNEPRWKRNVRNALQADKDALKLVNHAKGEWRLPTPLDERLALDPEASWILMCAAASEALESDKRFSSERRAHGYRVGSVEKATIVITRLDGNESARLGKAETMKSIERFNAAGGQAGVRTLNYTVAKEVVLVALHPDLQWSTDKEWVEFVDGRAASASDLLRPLRDEAQVHDLDGLQLDAAFKVEPVDEAMTLVWEQGGDGKNRDYGPALDILLSRLAGLGAAITAVYLERKRKESLPASERLLQVEGFGYPIRPTPADSKSIRLAIGRAGAGHRRRQGAKGSGNRQKRLRIHTTLEGHPAELESRLARGGTLPTFPPDGSSPDEDIEVAAEILGKEGALKVRQHRTRERDSAKIRRFKARYIKANSGRAPCQVCGFDFQEWYAGYQAPYIEAHHRTPLSEVDDQKGTTTRYEDLAFLCANCHRMVHRPFSGEYLTVEELARVVAGPRDAAPLSDST